MTPTIVTSLMLSIISLLDYSSIASLSTHRLSPNILMLSSNLSPDVNSINIIFSTAALIPELERLAPPVTLITPLTMWAEVLIEKNHLVDDQFLFLMYNQFVPIVLSGLPPRHIVPSG